MSSIANGELVPVGGGDTIPLIRDVLTVGRRDSCDIPLRRPNVSGLHCELSFRDGLWWLRDLGSTNGVKVNGTRVDKKRLLPGDTITIAKHTYTINYTPPAGGHLLGQDLPPDMEDDILSKPLLEKAGLIRPEREDRPRRPGKGSKKAFDPAQFLLGDEEEDE